MTCKCCGDLRVVTYVTSEGSSRRGMGRRVVTPNVPCPICVGGPSPVFPDAPERERPPGEERPLHERERGG
jgi:hypothetical protein